MTGAAIPKAKVLCRDETENLLIVEGKDDCHGIYQIAAQHGVEGTFGLWESGSDEKALERFGGLLLTSRNRLRTLGLVLDCDADDLGTVRSTARRWEQVRYRLRDLAYSVPDEPTPQGTIIESVGLLPRIGVWLMPDNLSEGMFEDFLLRLISPKALSLAQDAVKTAKEQEVGTYKAVHLSKAIAHTYLAWQDEPGRPIGLAIKSNLFDLQSPMAAPFVQWLRLLYQS